MYSLLVNYLSFICNGTIYVIPENSSHVCLKAFGYFTWNVFSAAWTIGQQANIFTAFGGCLVGSGLWVESVWTGWWISVDIDEFLGLRNNGLGWFQCWTSTSKNRNRYFTYNQCDALRYLRRMSSTTVWNSWLDFTIAIRRTASISTWRSEFFEKNGRNFCVFKITIFTRIKYWG